MKVAKVWRRRQEEVLQWCWGLYAMGGRVGSRRPLSCVLDTGISIHPSRWETSPKIIGLFLQSHFEMMNMSKSKTWFISIRD